MIIALAAAGWLLAQAAAEPAVPAAATPAPPTTVSEVKVEKEKDPLVCKSDTPVGSRLPSKKVCVRKSVVDAQRRQDRELTEAVQRSGGGPFQSRDR